MIQAEQYRVGEILPNGASFRVENGEHIAQFDTPFGPIDLHDGELIVTYPDGRRAVARVVDPEQAAASAAFDRKWTPKHSKADRGFAVNGRYPDQGHP